MPVLPEKRPAIVRIRAGQNPGQRRERDNLEPYLSCAPQQRQQNVLDLIAKLEAQDAQRGTQLLEAAR